MVLFNVEASIDKVHSDKYNKDYIVVKVPLTSSYMASIFLTNKAEIELAEKSDLIKNNTNNVDSKESINF